MVVFEQPRILGARGALPKREDFRTRGPAYLWLQDLFTGKCGASSPQNGGDERMRYWLLRCGVLFVVLLLSACELPDVEPSRPPLHQGDELPGDTFLPGLDFRPVNHDCWPLDEAPEKLSQTGCFSGTPVAPSDALIPYAVNAALWSDDADKERFLALPEGQSIVVQGEKLVYPPGTVFVKHFARDRRMLETRFLVRTDDGGWDAYTYGWNAEQTEAFLVGNGGGVVQTERGRWAIPSRAECFQCHTDAAGIVLGPELRQLKRDVYYPKTGRTAKQLDTWEAVGLFAKTLPQSVSEIPALIQYEDESAPIQERARAYLHANCSSCHRPGMPFAMDLRVNIPFQHTRVCNASAERGSPLDGDSWLIRPGEPENSVLLARMKSEDLAWRMPYVGSEVVDEMGVQLIEDWIRSLQSCDSLP